MVVARRGSKRGPVAGKGSLVRNAFKKLPDTGGKPRTMKASVPGLNLVVKKPRLRPGAYWGVYQGSGLEAEPARMPQLGPDMERVDFFPGVSGADGMAGKVRGTGKRGERLVVKGSSPMSIDELEEWLKAHVAVHGRPIEAARAPAKKKGKYRAFLFSRESVPLRDFIKKVKEEKIEGGERLAVQLAVAACEHWFRMYNDYGFELDAPLPNYGLHIVPGESFEELVGSLKKRGDERTLDFFDAHIRRIGVRKKHAMRHAFFETFNELRSELGEEWGDLFLEMIKGNESFKDLEKHFGDMDSFVDRVRNRTPDDPLVMLGWTDLDIEHNLENVYYIFKTWNDQNGKADEFFRNLLIERFGDDHGKVDAFFDRAKKAYAAGHELKPPEVF